MKRIPTDAIAVFLCLLSLADTTLAAELKQKTTDAFNQYAAATEARFGNELRPDGTFLYVDGLPADKRAAAYAQLKSGEILVEKRETGMANNFEVPDGMVHHWVGLLFVPGATLAQALPVLKDYDHRAELYKPDVTVSRLVSHKGDDYKIFMRLYQKRFTTAIFNTDYDVHWGQVDPKRMYSNSISTRLAEVKDTSKPDGEEYP